MSPLKEDLLNPSALPDRTTEVALVQTHISMVFIADAFVYKIKKPVKLDFLDFSTIEKRKYYCHQEVRLNQRLSKDLYLGVLPVLYGDGHYRIGEGVGEIVDYAVKMKRIPEERLMLTLFRRGRLSRKHVKAVADVLARFHRKAERSSEIDAYGRPEAFKINTDENFEETRKYIGVTLSEAHYRALSEWTEAFFRDNRALFLKRIEEGRIRDCHGDLHMEHVCLTDPVYIFDCIEFNKRFRYGDTLSDLSFLLMDLEYHGGTDIARQLWEFYAEQTGEEEAESVLQFYKIYRAYVRGKVNSFLLDDPQMLREQREEAARRAGNYFQLAYSYI